MHSSVLVPDGRVLVVGGYSVDALASAELFDPASGAFTPTGNLVSPTGGHTAALKTQLVLEISEQRAGGRRFVCRLVFEKP